MKSVRFQPYSAFGYVLQRSTEATQSPSMGAAPITAEVKVTSSVSSLAESRRHAVSKH